MKKFISIVTIILVFSAPLRASAHSFGKLYSLPVPFWMYLYGGAAAMIASFLFFGYFLNEKNSDEKNENNLFYKRIDLFKSPISKYLKYPKPRIFLAVLKILTVFLFASTILTGAFGENASYANFSMTFFWIVFVLGLSYATLLIGDIYYFINPWKIFAGWLSSHGEKPLMEYPKRFGYYPALLFYFIFIWFELVGGASPLKLCLVLLGYTLLTDIGVVLFGQKIWFRYCEFFSVFFRLIGKVAPIEYESGKIYLRLPLAGLVKSKAEDFSLVLFILFMLSSTSFDGFKETVVWTSLYFGHIDGLIRPIFHTYSYPVFESLTLLLSPFFFLLIYIVLIFFAKKIAGTALTLKELALSFAHSLIPIAIAYNIAHYYTLLLTEGPNLIRLLSDPFGFGWNTFNTANNSYSIFLGANFIWHSQVFFILSGHIAAVYLTHVVSINSFRSGKKTLASGIPILILMIAYTMIGLWILSEPLSGGTL